MVASLCWLFYAKDDMKPVTPINSNTVVSTRWALASLTMSMLLASLGTSIANVSLPALADAFDASFQSIQWVVLAYLLALTTLIVGIGRLGDILGRKRLLLAGLLLFAVGSGLCAASPTLAYLIGARVVQGTGAAVMMALTMACVADIIPKEQTGRAMGLLGTASAIGTALGPSLGGVLIAGFGWRAIFLVTVPLGLVTWCIARQHLPADVRQGTRALSGFDKTGTVLLGATLAAYALAMTLGRGHYGVLNGALLLVACAGVGLFIWVQQRVPTPLIRLAMFRDAALTASLAMTALVSTVMMTTLVVGPFYLVHVLALDPVSVGLVLAVGPLVAAVAGVPAGRMTDRFGPVPVTVAGLVSIVIGACTLSVFAARLGVPAYCVIVGLMTAGYALFQTANNTSVMAGVDKAQRGVVSAMLTLARNLGLMTGASAMGAVFAVGIGTNDLQTASPDAVAVGMQMTFAVAAILLVVALVVAIATGSRQRATTGVP